ncbi:sigma-70 family RNA polymerase sigma factor [Nocardia wallacei]|uniref:sigma-70 family RNA polymerase sigma factor n=1 Tax=Nocardia wallacei TaxID=480035 RepID=UPI002458DF9F|nr:sigma-70 family RNA polymerase sigma factor [Nocardia wallacei]
MPGSDDEFEAVRRDPDPLRRGRRATELITLYQQRATELARLRRVSIDEAHRDLGLNYKDIADQLGISKGRITQIRNTAPGPERAFFGVGPVSVGIPRRRGFEEGRERTFVDQSDLNTRATVRATLDRLSLVSTEFDIEADRADVPPGDTVVICGPKSAPVALALLAADPCLGFERDDERWWIIDDRGGQRFDSPYRREKLVHTDVGYFARHLAGDRVVIHIAGIMSVGSLGVARWLDENLLTLYSQNAAKSISGVVACDFDDDFAVTDSRIIAGPYQW